MLIFFKVCGICILGVIGLGILAAVPLTLFTVVGGIAMHCCYGAQWWFIGVPLTVLALIGDVASKAH